MVKQGEVIKFDMIHGKAGLEARYMIDKRGHLRVAITGSDHWFDWVANFWFMFKKRLSRKNFFNGSMHRIWALFAEALFRELSESVDFKEINKVYIRGHSMGGAVAEILSLFMVSRYDNLVTVDTWGGPSPWSWFGARTYRSIIEQKGINLTRFVCRGDIVPLLPGWLLGYNGNRGRLVRIRRFTWFWKAHIWLPKDWRGM